MAKVTVADASAVIASGATLLVGLGVEYAGIMLGAGGNGIRMSGRF